VGLKIGGMGFAVSNIVEENKLTTNKNDYETMD
jgi:hypothetical protein